MQRQSQEDSSGTSGKDASSGSATAGSARVEPPSAGSPLRASGLGTLAVLVLVGVGVTAGYMQWKAPEVRAIVEGRRNEVAAAPSTAEGRLVHWLKYGNALIHNRLQEMRFSAEQPWLVTYAVASSASDEGAAQNSGAKRFDMYGVDLTDLSHEPGRIEGQTVVVRLPRARDLGRGELVGDNAPFVPVVPDANSKPDADKRAHELAAWALQSLGEALERDIAGAHLTIEIGPESTWDEISRARSKDAGETSTSAPQR